MTKAEAKAMLKRIQEPEAWEPQINQAAFEALDMAIEALDCSEIPNSSDTISRQAAIDALADMHCKSDEDGYVWIIRSDAWARIDALPSVTPTKIVAQINFDNAKLKEIVDEAVKRLEEEK